jgi:exonuclease III
MYSTTNLSNLNGVNGNVTDRTTPGGSVSRQQDTFDRHQATVCKLRKRVKLATWNVRTLAQGGKLENLKQEASRLNLDILGISEMRWKNSGQINSGEFTVIYSGHKTKLAHGVGFLLKKELTQSLMGYYAISDRVLLIKINSKPVNMSIIQVYAPTSTSSDEDIESFYKDLDCAYNQCGSQDVRIVMGDMNAKVGSSMDPLESVVGPHGLGVRNERGDQWVEWCMSNDQVIMNSWFQHSKRHLYTWKSPGDGTRNQIDFITINQRYKRSILQVKTYPGADIGSDHIPVVSTMRFKFRKLKQSRAQSKLQIGLLKSDKELRMKFRNEINGRLSTITEETETEKRYEKFSLVLTETAEKVIPKRANKAKQAWMTEAILKKMNQRRLAKNNGVLYSELDREIRKDCTQAKEDMLNEQCAQIEHLDKMHNTTYMHSLIKKTAGTLKQTTTASCIECKDGTNT